MVSKKMRMFLFGVNAFFSLKVTTFDRGLFFVFVF